MVMESLLTPRGASADTIWHLWTKRRYMKQVTMYADVTSICIISKL